MSTVSLDEIRNTSGRLLLPSNGSIINVTQSVLTSATSGTTSYWSVVLSCVVSRVSPKSKMLIYADMRGATGAGYNRMEWGLLRDYSLIFRGEPDLAFASHSTASLTNTATGRMAVFDGGSTSAVPSWFCTYLDDENAQYPGSQTNKNVIYSIACRDANGDSTWYVNRGESTGSDYTRCASSLTVLEVS